MRIDNKRTIKIKKEFTHNPLLILLIILLVFFVLFLGGLTINASQLVYDELSIPILTYHKFCLGESTDEYTININHFKQQMLYLKKNDYRVISIAQLLKCIEDSVFPEKPVVITIDDGYKSVYTLAFPVLKEYGFPATLFFVY